MKRLNKFLGLVICCLFLCGCVNCNMNLTIEDQDNASLNVDFLIKEDSLYSVDQIKQQLLNSSDEMNDWTFKDIEKTIDDDKYHGFTMTAPDKQVKEILNHLSVKEKDGNTSYILEITSEELGSFDTSELSNYSSTLALVQGQGASFDLNIEMPGDITNSNIGKVKDNQVTINLLNYLTDSSLSSIKIEANDKVSDNSIYLYLIIGLLVILIIGGIYFYVSRKRNNENHDEREDIQKRCSHCNNIISDEDEICPICGQKLN